MVNAATLANNVLLLWSQWDAMEDGINTAAGAAEQLGHEGRAIRSSYCEMLVTGGFEFAI